MSALALDTSVSIPLLVRTHGAHGSVRRWLAGREAVLPAHALAETYSVLTRLPGDIRTSPEQAARAIDANFGPPLLPDPGRTARLHNILSELQITGGAVYDALVALTAADHYAELATRDERAHRTYERVGTRVVRVT